MTDEIPLGMMYSVLTILTDKLIFQSDIFATMMSLYFLCFNNILHWDIFFVIVDYLPLISRLEKNQICNNDEICRMYD